MPAPCAARSVLSRLFSVAIAIEALGLLPASSALADARDAPEQVASDLDVGTELVALVDVRLHRAEIGKGSKVIVTKLIETEGRVSGVDIALADGHVVPRVGIATIRTSFRVAEDEN